MQLRPGNIVMLSKDGVKGEHYAMYLYNNCYLSQLGDGGPIVLTDLEALHAKYQTTEIIRIKPGITQYQDFLANRLPIH